MNGGILGAQPRMRAGWRAEWRSVADHSPPAPFWKLPLGRQSAENECLGGSPEKAALSGPQVRLPIAEPARHGVDRCIEQDPFRGSKVGDAHGVVETRARARNAEGVDELEHEKISKDSQVARGNRARAPR
jgi:hypothetical protein